MGPDATGASCPRDGLARAWALGTLAAILLGASVPAAAAANRASDHYTLFGAYPGAAGGGSDFSTVTPMNRWQEKRSAVLNVFGDSGAYVDLLAEIWTRH